MDNFVLRNNFDYKKFSQVLFIGKKTFYKKGYFKNGYMEGYDVNYSED